jgi:hypothetical protein
MELYLGSLNATENALKGNVEFMIKVKSKNLTIEDIVYDLFNGDKDNKNNPFELFTIEDGIEPEDDGEDDFNYIVKEIARLKPEAKVIENESDYNMVVEFNDNPFLNSKIEITRI